MARHMAPAFFVNIPACGVLLPASCDTSDAGTARQRMADGEVVCNGLLSQFLAKHVRMEDVRLYVRDLLVEYAKLQRSRVWRAPGSTCVNWKRMVHAFGVVDRAVRPQRSGGSVPVVFRLILSVACVCRPCVLAVPEKATGTAQEADALLGAYPYLSWIDYLCDDEPPDAATCETMEALGPRKRPHENACGLEGFKGDPRVRGSDRRLHNLFKVSQCFANSRGGLRPCYTASGAGGGQGKQVEGGKGGVGERGGGRGGKRRRDGRGRRRVPPMARRPPCRRPADRPHARVPRQG